MKILITGHTNGLGKHLYNHFIKKGHFVLGVSRSNGYILPKNFDIVCDIAKTFDLFINNAYVDNIQTKFVEALSGKVKIISCGSIAANYIKKTGTYGINKLSLENTHKKLKRSTNIPMLLLKMGYLENYPDKFPIKYIEIINGIEFWLNNPRISMIEFENSSEIYI